MVKLAPLIAVLTMIVGCSQKPVVVNLPNFAVVGPGIFRGGQPTTNGWGILRMAGITNVVKLNLPNEGSDDFALAEGMVVNNFPIDMYDQFFRLKPELVNGAVAAIKEGTYIHCGSTKRTNSRVDQFFDTQGGQDRTGLIIAVYRIKNGWSKEKAEKEMLCHGFHVELHGLWDYWEDHVK